MLILGLEKSAYDESLKNMNKVLLSDEQLQRVSYILNIHSALRVLFENTENLYGFMLMNNHNAFFNGRKPIDIISTRRLDDLSDTFKRIDSLVIR
jgi:isochorismate synthase EntC